MNKEIQPTYVTFEQAKWLKEKRFNVVCPSFYTIDGQEHYKDAEW
jgi:hypothetical protein